MMLTTALVVKTSIITLMTLTIISYWVITEMTMLKELRYKGTALVFQILVWLELAPCNWGNLFHLWSLDSGFHAVHSGLHVLDSSLFQWNLNFGFQTLVGFWIPWAVLPISKLRIQDSTSKNFADSGIPFLLHGEIEWPRKMAVRSLVQDVRMVSSNSTFVLNTLTIK